VATGTGAAGPGWIVVTDGRLVGAGGGAVGCVGDVVDG
jgi:hypothetical protein